MENSIECRLASVPEGWVDVRLGVLSMLEKRSPDFSQASSIPHFSLGFSHLDSLLRPFLPERLTVLGGSASPAVAELAAFRAQLPVKAGGLDSTVLYVDSGNHSDPYLFSSFVKQKHSKPATAMRRVATCRIFTLYQLADFISNHLASVAEDYGTKLVVISDMLGTFNEPELEEREARRMLSAVEEGIERAKKKALVIVTLVSPNKYDDMVASWGDVVVNLSSSRGMMKAELLKHRNKPLSVSNFKLNQLFRAVHRWE